MKKLMSIITLGAMATLAFVPVFAHHSGAAYDFTKEATIEGEVKEWRWTNPHATLLVYVNDENGEKVLWGLVSTSPNILMRSGWTRRSVKAGDQIKVVISPMRNHKPGGMIVRVTLPDGKVLSARPGTGSASPPPASASDK